MAIVTCKYCGKKFDREKEPFIQIPLGQAFRYGHAECYQKAVNDKKETEIYQVWDPTTATTCFWCHRAVYIGQKDVIPMKELKGRYVHKACAEVHPCDDKEKLTIFLINLFKLKDDYILPKYAKQLTQYETEYHFTYSGMLKTLEYWYKVKKHPVDLTRGVGIIPYHYKEAHDYYYALWLADQENKNKDLNDYIPQEQVVVIKSPQRNPMKRKLFTFIEEDDIN